MRKSSFIMGIGIFTVLASAIYIAATFYPRPIEIITSFASITPLVRQIMVVDINQRDIFTAEKVQAGELPILAINPNNNLDNQTKIQLNFLDHIGRLMIFDTHNNNSLDTLDPIFTHLELVYLYQGNVLSTIPVIDAGIRTIYLDRGNLVTTELFPNGPKGYWNVTNFALLADGTKRNIRVIPMNANSLPHVNY